jgi:hypothetical protein
MKTFTIDQIKTAMERAGVGPYNNRYTIEELEKLVAEVELEKKVDEIFEKNKGAVEEIYNLTKQNFTGLARMMIRAGYVAAKGEK